MIRIVAFGNTISICWMVVGCVRPSLVDAVVNADAVGLESDRFCLDPESLLPM